MKSSYEYLKKYRRQPWGIYKIFETNVFDPLALDEVEEAEKKLGFNFPSQLREFYLKVGYGHLTTPHNPPSGYEFYNNNTILPPLTVAHFYQGIIEHHTIQKKEEALNYNTEYWFAHTTLEYVTPGDLPFFEIGDSESFLVMKPKSNNPNAVYSIGGVLIEKSFSKFIWRLYYESPSFYNNVILDFYEK